MLEIVEIERIKRFAQEVINLGRVRVIVHRLQLQLLFDQLTDVEVIDIQNTVDQQLLLESLESSYRGNDALGIVVLQFVLFIVIYHFETLPLQILAGVFE